jgi:AraC family transcriptional regulator of adaptative response/methylated-DNA-[protein]-cysteine methyltransferase
MTLVAARRETASPASASDEDRWAAVVRRDRRSDGIFYYSVQTTGVYCPLPNSAGGTPIPLEPA